MSIKAPTKIASFDIDAQKCFTPLCPTELPVPGGDEIVPELNRQALLADFRIGSKDAHPTNAVWLADPNHPMLSPVEGANVDLRWPLHAVSGTRGFELLDGLPHPAEYDFFVWKGIEPDMHPYGNCYHDLSERQSTGLIEFLHNHQVSTIICGGLATDYCVKKSVMQLLHAGFKVILNLAACRGIGKDTSDKAVEQMRRVGALIAEDSVAVAALLNKKAPDQHADQPRKLPAHEPIITSLLDTDLYKLTMMQCVLHQFPQASVEYTFKCRTPGINLAQYLNEINTEIDALCELRFSRQELQYLQTLDYISSDFIEFLRLFQLSRQFVITSVVNGEFHLTVRGPWLHTILFEVPLLAIINEVYFRNEQPFPDYGEGRRRLRQKIAALKAHHDHAHFVYSDFGTRRRFSKAWQQEVIETLVQQTPVQLAGTSNVLLAKQLEIKPLGTMAHEFLQACQQLGPRLIDSQKFALETWVHEYRGRLGIALTDVINIDAFLRDFDLYLAKLFDGVRHDSGDPFSWGEKVIAHYYKLGIDPKLKTLVFSDSLTMDKALALYDRFKERCRPAFGIGTHLTNDLGYQPIQIVIKMTSTNGYAVAKLSDNPEKSMCDDAFYVQRLQQLFNVTQPVGLTRKRRQ